MAAPRTLLLLVLGLASSWLGGAHHASALEAEAFEERLQAVEQVSDAARAARRLASLAAEAMQAGRLDWHFRAVAARALALSRAGEAALALRELNEAVALAQQAGQPAGEAELLAAQAEARVTVGEGAAAAGSLERAWRLALAASPVEEVLARRSLARLADVRRALGQMHLAQQAEHWLLALNDPQSVSGAETSLQPRAATVQVASDEVARTRFYLANATPERVSGTLLLDGGDLVLNSWRSTASGETAVFTFPAFTAGGVSSVPQGRRLTLQPGEIRVVTLEVEPNTPPRALQRDISAVWQTGETRHAAKAHFVFERARELADTTATQACHLRLNPFLTVPVYMEVYHRRGSRTHVQDLLPVTSQPCRVELYELTGGAAGRKLLAVDSEGDGEFDVLTDVVLSDRDRSGFPDVAFAENKPVVALELHIYPLTSPESEEPAEGVELSVSLRDGARWREPADVRHLLETVPPASRVP